MSSVRKIQLPDNTTVDINDERFHIYRTLTGTVAVTASPYTHAKWDVTDDTVAQYVDGMVVCIKVPVAGNGTYGTGFQINNLGYKPVVYNVNSMVSTRYGVGSVIWCVYNATQTASLYINSTSAVTVTGCWQVQDYDANTNTIGYQLRTNSSTRPVSSTTYRYRLMFSSLDNSKWVPATNSTSTNATSSRTVNQEVINPWGRIVYYSTTTAITAGQSLSVTAQWDRYVFNLGYSFNDGTALDLTFPGPVYIKCTPQAGGGAIIDSTTPYTQSLPSTADGKIYIYLGQAYSASEVELIDYHPVLYHDGTKISLWTGAVAESDLFDCVMTLENNVWSCDHTWAEIYAAHQAGKLVRLTQSNGSVFMPLSIDSVSGIFSACLHMSLGTITELSGISSFIYDSSGDLMPLGWSFHQTSFNAFTSTYKDKLDGIAAGAEVNVQSDWNQSDSTADDFIKNKPTIPDAVSGVNDGTNWTSITIGTKTYSIPSGGGVQALTSPIRIWDLNPGVYILPSPCTVYYSGSSNTSSSATIYGGILQVFSTSSDTIRKWKVTTDLSEDTNPVYPNRFYWGATTSSSGNISSVGYLTSQRPACNSGTSDYSISFNNIGSNLARNSYSVLSNGVVTGKISSSTTSIPVALTTDLSAETAVVMTVINPSDYNVAGNYVGRQDLYVTELNRHFYRFFNFTNSGITSIVTNTTGADANGWVEVFERLPSIDELNETNISSPTNGQILKYNSTTSKWENANETTELPSITGNANKILAVNSGATGVEWITKPSSDLTNYDFTHTANTTISGSTTTVTFDANTRGSAMLTISADLGLTIACNNGSDNYIWVKNTGSSEVDVTISGVTKNSTNVSNVYVPSDGISVPAGGLCEIGVIVNTDGAFITSRNDLAL